MPDNQENNLPPAAVSSIATNTTTASSSITTNNSDPQNPLSVSSISDSQKLSPITAASATSNMLVDRTRERAAISQISDTISRSVNLDNTATFYSSATQHQPAVSAMSRPNGGGYHQSTCAGEKSTTSRLETQAQYTLSPKGKEPTQDQQQYSGGTLFNFTANKQSEPSSIGASAPNPYNSLSDRSQQPGSANYSQQGEEDIQMSESPPLDHDNSSQGDGDSNDGDGDGDSDEDGEIGEEVDVDEIPRQGDLFIMGPRLVVTTRENQPQPANAPNQAGETTRPDRPGAVGMPANSALLYHATYNSGRGAVWRFFSVVETRVSGNTDRAECNYCNKRMLGKSADMKKHIVITCPKKDTIPEGMLPILEIVKQEYRNPKKRAKRNSNAPIIMNSQGVFEQSTAPVQRRRNSSRDSNIPLARIHPPTSRPYSHHSHPQQHQRHHVRPAPYDVHEGNPHRGKMSKLARQQHHLRGQGNAPNTGSRAAVEGLGITPGGAEHPSYPRDYRSPMLVQQTPSVIPIPMAGHPPPPQPQQQQHLLLPPPSAGSPPGTSFLGSAGDLGRSHLVQVPLTPVQLKSPPPLPHSSSSPGSGGHIGSSRHPTIGQQMSGKHHFLQHRGSVTPQQGPTAPLMPPIQTQLQEQNTPQLSRPPAILSPIQPHQGEPNIRYYPPMQAGPPPPPGYHNHPPPPSGHHGRGPLPPPQHRPNIPPSSSSIPPPRQHFSHPSSSPVMITPGTQPSMIKAKLSQHIPMYGVWLTIPSPVTARTLAAQGFDWACIDMVHSPTNPTLMAEMVAAVASSGRCIPIVRVPSHTPEWFKWALDAGALGVIVPNVNTPEDMRHAIQQCSYPPVGNRSAGTTFAGQPYGGRGSNTASEHTDHGSILVIPQIESAEGVANLKGILGCGGLDAIFVGPYNQHTHARSSSQSSIDFSEAQGVVEQVAREANVALGTYAPSGEVAWNKAKNGYTLVVVANDAECLITSAVEHLDRARGEAAIVRIPTSSYH